MRGTAPCPILGAPREEATLVSTSRPATSADVDALYDLLLPRDPVLAGIADVHGRPDPFRWAGEGPGGISNFAALVLHVVGQQISTTVALLLFGRLETAAGGRVDPRSVARLDVESMRALGLSHAKAVAVAGLAQMH